MYMVLNNKLRRRCLLRILGRWLTGTTLDHVSIFQGDKSATKDTAPTVCSLPRRLSLGGAGREQEAEE